MKLFIKLSFSLLFLVLLFSKMNAQNNDFRPFEMTPELFEKAKVVDGQEVTANGQRYRVVLEKNTRGIQIWATKKNGKMGWLNHGIHYSFRDGKLNRYNTWNYGLMHGEHKSFHSNGNVMFHYMKQNGKKHGFYRYYYDDGSLRQEGQYENGKWEGKLIRYFDGKGNSTGVLSSVANYQNGKRHGEQLSYYSNGKMMSSSRYNQGEKVGKTVHHSWRK